MNNTEDGDYSAPEDPSHRQPHTTLTTATHAPSATAKARTTQAGI